MAQARALFLDRDGVINQDAGYTHKIEAFEFIDGIFGLCRTARGLGYRLVVVTNQAGIGRGHYTEADFQRLTTWMKDRFADAGAPLDAVYHCPYHPDGIGEYRRVSDWRKPAPGMLLQAATDLALDLRASLLVGDSETDIQAANTAGLGAAVRFAAPQTHSAADAVLATHAEVTDWLIAFSRRHTP